MPVSYERRGEAAVVTFDNPPLNVFGQAMRAGLQAAIARASARTGVDFSYLLAQARIESGLDPQAEARTSSASGLFQFIDGTWLRAIRDFGAHFGLEQEARLVEVGELAVHHRDDEEHRVRALHRLAFARLFNVLILRALRAFWFFHVVFRFRHAILTAIKNARPKPESALVP